MTSPSEQTGNVSGEMTVERCEDASFNGQPLFCFGGFRTSRRRFLRILCLSEIHAKNLARLGTVNSG